MGNQVWKQKIAGALMEKGFSKKSAGRVAKATMKKSQQAKERKESAPLHGKVKIIMKDGIRLQH
jgi:hypothetical protein